MKKILLRLLEDIPKIGLITTVGFILIILNGEIANFLLKVWEVMLGTILELFRLFVFSIPEQDWWWHLPIMILALVFTRLVGGLISDKIRFPIGIVAFCFGIVWGIGGELLSINYVMEIHNFNFTGTNFGSWLIHMSDMVAGFILLGIGLEILPRQIQSVGRTSFRIAVAGIAVPLFLTVIIVFPYMLLTDNSSEFSNLVWSSLAAGSVLMATSVAFKGAIFESLGLRGSRLSQTIFGSGVFDDIMSIVFFTVLITLHSAFKTGWAMSNFADIASIVIANFLLIIFTFTIGEYWSRLLLILLGRYMWARYSIPVINFLIFALIGKKLGISIISSAFFAGLMMSPCDVIVYLDKISCYSFKSKLRWVFKGTEEEGKIDLEKGYHDALNRLGFHLINKWISPLFFLITGLMVPIQLFGSDMIVLSLLFTLFPGILGKLSTVFVVDPAKDKIDPWAAAIAMLSRGEVGLIILALLASSGILSPVLIGALALTVVLTTISGAKLMHWRAGLISDEVKKNMTSSERVTMRSLLNIVQGQFKKNSN